MRSDRDLRRKIFDIIDYQGSRETSSKKVFRPYDFFMMMVIYISLIPMGVKEQNLGLFILDKVTLVVFIIDYILRLITADFKLKKGKASFWKYPFTFMAVVDLLAILPSIAMISRGFQSLKLLRLFRLFFLMRVFKVVRHSKNIRMMIRIFQNKKTELSFVLALAVGYVLVSALVIFNVEPETFHCFFDALYWAAITLSTVGYGDLYAVSVPGKIVTMISVFMGIVIVTLPAGLITAGYMEELKKRSEEMENDE